MYCIWSASGWLRRASTSLLGLTHVAFAQTTNLQIGSAATGQVQIRWTHQAPGFVLETTASLAPPAVWDAVPTTPQADGNLRTVTVEPAGDARFYRLRQAGLTRVVETSPAAGESGVSVTRETVLRFTGPLAPDTQIATGQFLAEFGGRRLLSRVELSGDRRQATLFYLEPLPAGSRVQVTFVSDDLLDAQGQAMDGDGDGQPGGTRRFSFDTMNSATVPGTAVFGRVYASDPVPNGNGFTNRPLAGVIVTADGAEERVRATTDQDGYFRLFPSPAGRFFVHLDGRPAFGSDWPSGNYYPFVGKTFEAVPGSTNNPAGGTGEVFLPLVKAGTLQPISPTQPTTIGFPAAVLAEHPELAGVNITVPANSLYADDGTRGGRVGIAPVAPDRIPSPLPPGLSPALVITIQTDGPSNFDQLVPVRFPNLPDPVTGIELPPGAKSTLWSYNHDTGRWESQGSMTVSADGKYLESDPGVGVRQPGWHAGAPGSPGSGPGAGDGPCASEQQALEDALFGCAFGIGLGLLELAPAIGCGISIASAVNGAIQGCSDPNGSCAGSIAYNAFFGAAGCVPGPVGTFAGLMQCGIELGDATANLAICQDTTGALSLTRGSGSSSGSRPSPRLAGNDALVLQDELSGAAGSLIASILGDSIWMNAAQGDPERMAAFANSLVAALDPASDGGARLTAAEQSSLIALPAPAGLENQVRQALLDRFDRFAQGGILATEASAIRDQAEALNLSATMAQSLGWTTMFDGLTQSLEEIAQDFDREANGGNVGGPTGARLQGGGPVLHADGPPIGPRHEGVLFYRLVDQADGATRYGRTEPSGTIPQLITRIDWPYLLTYFDPVTLDMGSVLFRSGAAGTAYTIPYARLAPVTGLDSDEDGLPDLAEAVVGTNPHLADTDGDGATDFEEARQGRNPLDGIVMSQGVVGTVMLGGTAARASALGLHLDGSLLFVANGRRGLAIVDVRDPLQPAWLSELVLPGTSEDVTYDPGSGVVALSGSPDGGVPGERGLVHFVDASNLAAPRLLETYSVPAAAVDAWNGRIFVALGDYASKEVHIHDARSALRIGLFTAQDFPTGLRVVGGRAYVATLSGLEIWNVTVPAPVRLGRLPGDFSAELLGRAHLVLEGNLLYVGKVKGVATVDVSDPAAPKFVGQSPATAGAVRALALSGGGRLVALTLGTPSGNSSAASTLSVFNVTDPANLTVFELGLTPQWRGRDVVMAGGYALVADDSAGISVMNFAGPDFSGQPPAISFDAAPLDQDPGAAGIQVPEGETLELAPVVRDDVHLERVQLLVDGRAVSALTTYPASFRLVVPSGSSFNTNLVVQFQATDRSGNTAVSPPLILEVLRDAQPPSLVASFPVAGGAAFLNHPLVLTLDEAVDTVVLDLGKVGLVGFGADGARGGGDDFTVAPAAAMAGGSLANLILPAGLTAGRYELTLQPGFARDRAGNPLAESHVIAFDLLAVPPGSAVWISDADGRWSDPANWLNRHLPVQDDEVLIQRFGARPVVALDSVGFIKSLTIRSPLKTAGRANLQVLRDLAATESVEVSEGDLGVDGAATFDGTLTLSGGRVTVAGRLEVHGALTLTGGSTVILTGPEAQFVPTGGVQGTHFTLLARDGAKIDLPGLVNLDAPGDFTGLFPVGTLLRAQGLGSRLTLTDLASATGPVDWNVRGAPSLSLEASGGGELELPKLATLAGRVKLVATGDGSVLDAPVLTSVQGSRAPFTAAMEASFNGRVQVPKLTTIADCPITETDGGVVERPGR